MASTFRLQGSWTSTPCACACGGAAELSAQVNACMPLAKQTYTTIELTTDDTTTVSFGDCNEANVIVIQTVGGKVKARFTSADGSQQAVPVDPYLTVISGAVPFTALDITRAIGQPTTYVRVFIGQKAT